MATLILTLLPIILNTYRRDILRSPPFHSTQLSILSRTPAIRLKKKAVIKENNACTKLEPRGNPSYTTIHLPNKLLKLLQNLLSNIFFLPDSFNQKNVRTSRSIAIKRGKGNCPDLRGALLGERVGQHLSYESDPGSQDEQSSRRWYRATIHNTCTCRRGKVDGRDLDARGSRVPEAARTITNSAEAG